MSNPLKNELVTHYQKLDELLKKIRNGELKVRYQTTTARIEQAISLLMIADHHR